MTNAQRAAELGVGNVVAAIGNAMFSLGFGRLNPRQIDAVHQAGKIIFDEMEKPHRHATQDSGLKAWAESDDTNFVSRFMAQQLADRSAQWLVTISDRFPAGYVHVPERPIDFALCLGLIRSVPDFKLRIGEMAVFGPEWRGVVNNWDELEVLLEEEYPTGQCPKLTARMAEVIAAEVGRVDRSVDPTADDEVTGG